MAPADGADPAVKENGLTCETLDEWRETMMEFRRCFASREIMSCQERRDNLLRGVAIMWLRLEIPQGDRAEAEELFKSAMDEYTARAAMIAVALEEKT